MECMEVKIQIQINRLFSRGTMLWRLLQHEWVFQEASSSTMNTILTKLIPLNLERKRITQAYGNPQENSWLVALILAKTHSS